MTRQRTGLFRLGIRRSVVIVLGLVFVGCVLDDITGPDRTFSDLGLVGDSVMAVGSTQEVSVSLISRTGLGPARILWSSSDSAVATVSDGLVTALRQGSARITARLTGPDISEPIVQSLTLVSQYQAIGIEPVDSLTGVGERRTVTTRGLDTSGAPNEVLKPTYESSDTSIFVIDTTGILTSTGPGTAVLTATLDSLTAEIPVSVHQVAGSVVFADSVIVFTSLGRDTAVAYQALDTNRQPMGTIESSWSTSDSTAITIVGDGILRPLRVGTTTVTVVVDTVVTRIRTIVDQTPVSFTRVQGNDQTAQVGTNVALPPAVTVYDGGGYIIVGEEITFSITEGDGSVTDSTVTSDSNGIATVTAWTLGTTAGANEVRAHSGGVSLSFTATGTPGVVSEATSLITAMRDTVVSGAETALFLSARDAWGNELTTGGSIVTFSISGGSSDGTIGTTTDFGNGRYSAAFRGSTVGTPVTVSATLDGKVVTSPAPQIVVVPGATASSLSIDSGNGQTAVVGTAVGAPLRVVARDPFANPVENVVVTFSIASGAGTAVDSIVATDENGVAEIGAWILGETAGPNTLSAQSGVLSLAFVATGVAGPGAATTSVVTATPSTVAAGDTVVVTLAARDEYGNTTTTGGQDVTFSASGGSSTGVFGPVVDEGDGTYTTRFVAIQTGDATTISATIDGDAVASSTALTVQPGSVTQLLLVIGDEQYAPAGSTVDIAPTVEARDPFNNAVPGAAVVFSVVEGGGSVTGSPATTGQNGQASAGSWTLGSDLGENRLRATSAGLSVDFVATATAGTASPATSSISVPRDTVVAGEQVTLTLTTRDAFGFDLTTGGAAVTFSTSGGTSTGTVGATTDRGDGTYTATFEGVSVGTALTVSATLNGQTVTTTLPTLVVRAAASATSLTVQEGDGQTAAAGTAVTTPPSVVARDASSNPVANVVVTFTITSGGGIVTDSVVATDSNGVATLGAWTLGTAPGENTISASAGSATASFSATGSVGAGDGSSSILSVPADTLVAGDTIALSVRVLDSFGNEVSVGGQSVVFSLSGGTSDGDLGSVQDNGDGTYGATFIATTAGTTTSLTATLDGDTIAAPSPITVLPGAPTTATVVDGNNQTAAAGTNVPQAPRIRVTDAYGNPVSGVTAAFSVLSGGGSLTGPVATTDEDGRAQVGSWALGSTPGSNTMRATAASVWVDFTATGVIGTGDAEQSTLTIPVDSLAAGDSTTLTVTVRDQFGNDLPSGGQTVVFTASGGTSEGDISPVSDGGDGTYTATFAATTAGSATTIVATLDGDTIAMTEEITVVPGDAALLTLVAGDGQVATVGQPVASAPLVRVEDGFGNARPGVAVTFSVLTGGGSTTGATATTDGSGEAQVGSWILGSTPGSNTLRAAIGVLTVDFTATATVGSVSPSQSIVTTSADSLIAGATVLITLQARDSLGNDVQTGGAVVEFQLDGGTSDGTLGAVADNGDGTYEATLEARVAGTPATLSATINGDTVTSVMPTITIDAAPADSIVPLAGDGQSDIVGSLLGTAPRIRVEDAFGNPVIGAPVTFSVIAGGGLITGATVSTDAAGEAEIGSWTLGTDAGTNTLRATVGALTTDFTATALVGAVSVSESVVTTSVASLTAGSSAVLTVETRDAFGNAITTGGATVTFGLGGGTSDGVIGAVVDQGDGTYEATLLGQTAGTASTLEASIDGEPVTSTLPSITVVAGAADTVVTIAGDGQSAVAGTPVLIAPRVRVDDDFGNPVAGDTVTFSVVDGGGSVTEATVTTDAAGEAEVGSWTLGTSSGTNTLRATVGALTTDFTATALVGAPSATESTVSVNVTSLVAGTSAVLSVDARDTYGNPITTGGSVVTFALSGGTSDGVIGTVVDQGDGSYEATLLGQTAGTASTIDATIDGQTITSTLPTISITAAVADTILVVAGDGQATVAGTPVVTAPRIRVEDDFGNPVSGESVTFSVSTGGGLITGATTTTDAAGEAEVGSWTLGTDAGTNTLSATVGALTTDVTANALAGDVSASASVVTTSTTSLTAGASALLTLEARDAFGNAITTGGSTVTFDLGGGTSDGAIGAVVDQGDGTYEATLTGQTAGTASTISATIDGEAVTSTLPTISIAAGVADAVVAIAGDAQSAVVGTLLATAPRIRVDDEFGNPVSGESVTFSVIGGGGIITGATVSTDASGEAEVGSWTLGTGTGTNTLRATVGALTTDFTATALAGAASAAESIVTTSVGSLTAGASALLTLEARDAFGNAITTGGSTVTFDLSGGTSDGAIGAVVDQGDGTYEATLTGQTAGTASTISATIDGEAVTSTLPTISIAAGVADAVVAIAGDAQSAVVGTLLATAPRIRVDDEFGNPVSGESVTFSVIGGGGIITGATVTTDASGEAEVGSWTLGTGTGTNTLRATVGALTTDFTATALAGAASAAESIVTTSVGSLTAGASALLTLEARDAFGNAITTGGATVTFDLSGGTSDGAIGAVVDQGDGTYEATLTGQTAGTASTISATIDGEAVTSTLPTISIAAGVADAVVAIAGDAQSAVVGTLLATAPRVRVDDEFGNPVSGASVTFSVIGGGGIITGATVTTDASGEAEVGSWTLGALVGTNTLRATVGALTTDFTATALAGAASAAESIVTTSVGSLTAGASALLTLEARDAFGNAITTGGSTVTFGLGGGTSDGVIGAVVDQGDGTYEATLLGQTAGTVSTISATIDGEAVTSTLPTISIAAGVADAVVAIAGDAQSAVVGTLLATAPRVRVDDEFGNPVSGASVTFSVIGGGGIITGATVSTDASGEAEVGSWTLGALIGTNTLRATVGALTTDFTATALAGAVSAAESIVTTSVGSLTAGASALLTLEARDAFGNAITTGGSTVTFGLGGGTSDGAIGAVVDQGDGTYEATLLGQTAGTVSTISATIDGEAVTSTLPTISIAAGVADAVVAIAGDAQSAVVGTLLATAPRVRVDDEFGNPVSGTSVTFSVIGNGGIITGATVSTDAAGEAEVGSWTLSTVAGTSTLRATVGALTTDFTATALVGAASAAESIVTTSIGSLLAGASALLTLEARDSYGNAITTGGSTVTFGLGGGTSDGVIGAVVDQGDGTYEATLLGQVAGTVSTISATIDGEAVTSTLPTISIAAGVADAVVAIAGDAQSAVVGTLLATAPRIRVDDEFGNPVSGASVTFSVIGGGGLITGATISTDASGEAEVGSWTLGTVTGTNTLRATVGALTTDFTVTALAGAVSAAESIVTTSVGSLLAGASAVLSLEARDAFGNAITTGGSTVTFALSGGTSDGVIGAVVDQGDGTYEATLLGQVAGTVSTVGATIDGQAVTSTLPTIGIAAGAADAIVAVAGDALSTVVGTLLGTEPRVRIDDAFGNPVSGVSVTFSVTGGGGIITGATVSTDASGEAEVGSWLLGTLAGANTLRATAGALTTDFTASATPDVGSVTTTLVTSLDATILVAQVTTIIVTVLDQYGNPVGTGGHSVALSTSSGIGIGVGLLGPVIDVGNGTYTATYAGVTIGAPVTISATLDGAPVIDVVQIQVSL